MFDYLSHYYNELPFHTISDLTDDARSRVLEELALTRSLPYRLTCADYFPRRRAVERRLRDLFVECGGKPVRRNPHYMILGNSPFWERKSSNCVKVPLSCFGSEIISFTFTDSFYAFSGGQSLADRLRNSFNPEWRSYDGALVDELMTLINKVAKRTAAEELRAAYNFMAEQYDVDPLEEGEELGGPYAYIFIDTVLEAIQDV